MKLPVRTLESTNCVLVGSKENEYEKGKFSYSLALVCDGAVANVKCDHACYVESEKLIYKPVQISGEFDTTYKNFTALLIREDSKAVKGA